MEVFVWKHILIKKTDEIKSYWYKRCEKLLRKCEKLESEADKLNEKAEEHISLDWKGKK